MPRLRSGISGGTLMVIGVALAIVAAFLVWRYMQTSHKTVLAVVATHDVPPMAEVGATDLELAPVPMQGLPQDAIRSLGLASGHFVRYGLLKGQVVRQANLATTSAGASGFDARLEQVAEQAPAGQELRAVTLAVPASLGFVLPQPGDHVDLLMVLKSGPDHQARVIAPHVLVLDRLGGETPSAPTVPGASRGQPAAPTQQGILVLALTVQQAQQVALAQVDGTVQVVLDPLKATAPTTAGPFYASAWSATPQPVGGK